MSLLLLLASPTGSGTSSYTLNDTASVQINEGNFDTIDLFLNEIGDISASVDAISQASLFNQGETANLNFNEGIVATIGGTTSQSVADTASVSVSEAILQFDGQATLAETANVQVNESVALNNIQPKGPLAETASVAVTDSFLANIFVPVTIQVPADDLANVSIAEVAYVTSSEAQQVAQMTFTPYTDSITFTVQ